MPGRTEQTISLKTLRQNFKLKYKPFLINLWKIELDWWIKLPKERENVIYLWEEDNGPCSASTQKLVIPHSE